MPRINEYPETQQLASTDLLLIDQGGGVYKSIEAGVMIDKIQSQAVGLLYTRCVLYGVTPEAKTPRAVDAAMEECCENSYAEGRERGRSQGREDVGNNLSYQGGFGQGMSGSHNYTVDKDHYILICTILSSSSYNAAITNVTGAEFISMMNFNTNLSAAGGWREVRLYKTTGTTVTVTKNGMPSDIFIIELGPCE